MMEVEPGITEVEHHIIAGCSDSRDIKDKFNKIKDARLEQEKKNGKLILVTRISVPGVFATPEVVSELKTSIFEVARDLYQYSLNDDVSISYYVHMMAHGDAVLKEGADPNAFDYRSIEIKPSPTNCGMMNAQPVAKEFETMLIENKAQLKFGTTNEYEIQIATLADMEKLMMMAHNFNGTLGGNWVKSIVDLATHAYEQKKVLRQVFDSDPTTKQMQIRITAGVQNYGTDEYFRVDGNTHLRTFLDEVYQEVRSGDKGHDHEHRTTSQTPSILLFHHSGINNARAAAAAEIMGSEQYSAGSVFAIGSCNAGDHFRFFGPYKTTGFFYAAKHLKLSTWAVMGRTIDEVERMVIRLQSDPLVGYILKEKDIFNIRLEKMVVDPRQSFPHLNKSGEINRTPAVLRLK